ncbi:hypothetical protein ACHAQH_004462 [Verticillium albo-atrum]
MPNDDILTDDYLAEVLAKEAADCSLKYSSVGMEAFRAEKKPPNKLKPNKRFLQHIIKDTDRHNANLLAKETAESQARLRALEKTEEREKRKTAAPQDVRRRQMGDILSILGGRKTETRASSSRRSTDAKAERDSTPASTRRRHRDGRSASPERSDHKRRRRERVEEADSGRESGRKHTSHRRRNSQSLEDGNRRRRHRSRTPLSEDNAEAKSRRSDKGRTRDRSGADLTSKHRRTSRDKSPTRVSSRDLMSSSGRTPQESVQGRRYHDGGRLKTERSRRDLTDEAMSDSDPLDDIVGPAPPPPVRTRGRGFQTGPSVMDKHFEASYDPKADFEMNETTDNWDDAIETFRDRQKWQQSQEQRLRAAGFGDEEIKKWKRGGERSEDEVKWTKAGEKREWDRGKDGELKGLFSEDN